MVYYRFLFNQRKKVSYGEAFVYSLLLDRSIMRGQFYDVDGSFSMELLRFEIEEFRQQGMGEYIFMQELTTKYISDHTEITPQNVRIILKSLREKRIIREDMISCPLRLLEHGYINLPEGTSLKGSQLICYGLILDMSKRYNGTISTWASELGRILGITETNVHSILSILHKKGFVKRDNATKKLIVY